MSLAILVGVGCTAAATETDTGESNVEGGSLDDLVAKSLLVGGCEVVVNGALQRTAGDGGKCPTTFSAILDTMDNLKSQTFVVSEDADQPQAMHRFVVGATGELAGKLFVANVGGGGNISEDGVEAIGFSQSLQAFAYYKVEGGRWIRKGDGTQVKAGSSQAPFECVNCHTTGAPLMKELHDSWGNWTSTWFSVPAPAQQSPLFRRLFDKVERADELENLIISGIKLHSKGRVERAASVNNLKGVLTQLMCEVGEPSIIGAHSANGQRLASPMRTFSQMLPGAIVLNQLLVAPQTGGTGVELGLEQSLNVNAPSFNNLRVDPNAYSAALEKNRQTIGGRAGDAIFPMSSPEKSHADLDAIQELLRQNLVDQDIVADVLFTDFTVSAFSKIRCDLAETIPNTWTSPAELKTAWAKSLNGSQLRGAKALAKRLETPNDLASHTAAIEAYGQACASRGSADAAAFTEDVLKIVSQRRVEWSQRYKNVIESDWLVPVDALGSKPNALRLDPKTCEVVKASSPAGGE